MSSSPDDAASAGARERTRARRQALRTLRNPLSLAGLLIIGSLIVVALTAPIIAPYDPIKTDTLNRFQAPGPAHRLGTDQLRPACS